MIALSFVLDVVGGLCVLTGWWLMWRDPWGVGPPVTGTLLTVGGVIGLGGMLAGIVSCAG